MSSRPARLAAIALLAALAAGAAGCSTDPPTGPATPSPAAASTTTYTPSPIPVAPVPTLAVPVTTVSTPPMVGPAPDNGTVITRRGGGGSGVLSVDNGTDSDALVTLAIDGQARREVFVRAGKKTKLSGIADGDYTLFFTSGEDFDRTTRRFLTSPTFEMFPGPATFATENVKGGTRYTIYECTLQAVPDGNITPEPVSGDSYPS